MTTTTFNDGDQLRGHYGNVWTRVDGQWWLPTRGQAICDDTVRWLMGLDLVVSVGPRKTDKISKTQVDPVPPMIYRFKLGSA